MVSRFLPEKDGIAIYTENLVKSIKSNIIKIGTTKSKKAYKLKFDSLNFYKELNKIIKKEKLDIIHFQYIAPWYGRYSLNYPLIKTLKKIKIPKIVTLHEVQYSNKGLKNKILERIEKKILKYSNKVIIHTDQQAKFINKKYNTNKAKCIYMGVDIKKNNPQKGKNILFFGMMSEGKGVIDLIKAKGYLPEYRLKIAGRPVTKKYKNMVLKSAKNKDIDIILGWISEKEKEKLYSWANMVVLPYRWAPYQSAVLHDAISYNLPVIATKVGAVWEIVDKFGLGEVTVPKNPKALAENIQKIYNNYQKYKKGLENYRKKANWKNTALEHLKAYNKVI